MSNDALAEARKAIALAFEMPEGPDRQAALDEAVEHRMTLDPGGVQLTTALMQLGRTDEIMPSLVDEVTWEIREGVTSPMMRGAWGVHLVGVFHQLAEDRAALFERFVQQSLAREGDDAARVLQQALNWATSVKGEQDETRHELLSMLEELYADWASR